jgi:hypothetical protein
MRLAVLRGIRVVPASAYLEAAAGAADLLHGLTAGSTDTDTFANLPLWSD